MAADKVVVLFNAGGISRAGEEHIAGAAQKRLIAFVNIAVDDVHVILGKAQFIQHEHHVRIAGSPAAHQDGQALPVLSGAQCLGNGAFRSLCQGAVTAAESLVGIVIAGQGNDLHVVGKHAGDGRRRADPADVPVTGGVGLKLRRAGNIVGAAHIKPQVFPDSHLLAGDQGHGRLDNVLSAGGQVDQLGRGRLLAIRALRLGGLTGAAGIAPRGAAGAQSKQHTGSQ